MKARSAKWHHLRDLRCILMASIGVLGICLFSLSGIAQEKTAAFQFSLSSGSPIIFCEVQINRSSKELFMIDTAATNSILDTQLAAQIGATSLVRLGQMTDGAGNKLNMPYVQPPEIKLGEEAVRLKSIAVTDLRFIHKFCGLDVRGILGVDALIDKIIELDFDREVMKIYRDDEPRGQYQKNMFVRRTPAMSRSFGGVLHKIECGFLIDTGYNGFMAVRKDYFHQLTTEGMIKLSNTHSENINPSGGRSMTCGTFTAGELLGLELKGYEVGEALLDESVGLGFLRAFNMAIDFPNSRMHYSLRKGYSGSLDAVDMLGMKLTYGKEGVFASPIIGAGIQTPARLLKIAEGDRLLEIGGIKAQDINCLRLHALCEEKAGTEITIAWESPSKRKLSTRVRLPARIYDKK